jgi:cobalt-zinc-cadmium efflux system outer membrane protein
VDGLKWRMCLGMVAASVANYAAAQQPLTWQQVREKFESVNPTLQALRVGIDESKAQEITAYLRPNPDFSLTADGFQVNSNGGGWRPLSGVLETPSVSYLHERQHKRELRRDSARQSTAVAESQLADQERTLLFNLRNAFVQALQAKAVVDLARQNLSYYDQLLTVNRDRLQAGDIARVDLDRLELQRVQYESDVQTALVNLRTSKIQLLTLLNDRTAVDQFDVTGTFDFSEQIPALEEFRAAALAARPDLRAAMQSIDLAKMNHHLAMANGSADPTFSAWFSHNPSFANPFANDTIGGSVSIPLRIFDRNQGEKLRTQLDIGRNERLRDANAAQVFSDVDSAYATLNSNLTLLRPYKAMYLQQAVRVRDTVAFSYRNGGASLLDLLQSQQEYRGIQLSYLNLVGSYLTAAAQLNQAVGREVIVP